jgi:hypothetical protein
MEAVGVGTAQADSTGLPPLPWLAYHHLQYGLDGNDTLTAYSLVSSQVFAGAGDDKVSVHSTAVGSRLSAHGEAGNDTINGSHANDDLWGGSGWDRIMGSAGNDEIYGGTGADQIDGGIGNDSLFASAPKSGRPSPNRWAQIEDVAADGIFGGEGSDSITGGGGGMVGLGQNGNDSFCSLFHDTLYGGAGNDWFRFGLNDLVPPAVAPTQRLEAYGGIGSDIFVLRDIVASYALLQGGTESDLFYIFSSVPAHIVGEMGSDLFDLRAERFEQMHFYYKSAYESTRGAEDAFRLPFGSGSGEITIHLDSEDFSSPGATLENIDATYDRLIFNDRMGGELAIRIDNRLNFNVVID